MKPCHRLDQRVKEFKNIECPHKRPTTEECYDCLKRLGGRVRMLLDNIIYCKWRIRHKRRKAKEKAKRKEKKK